jgi:asparagine synthase (glutamine-hydrolysing)
VTICIALIQAEGPVPALPGGYSELGTIGTARLVGKPGTIVAVSGAAALVGYAFHRDSFASCPALDPGAVEHIVRTEGAWAIRKLWGTFILIWADASGQVFALRSPLTGPALFQTRRQDDGGAAANACCAFTDLGLARALGFRLDRPDPGAIDAYLRYPLLRTPRSTITGATEVLPGEITRLGHRERRPASWLPWDYASSPPIRAEANEFGSLVRATVGAWSGRFARVQLELSGGIDSSIVAACLSDRSDPWRAITMVTPEPDGDERLYARAMAERANAPLAELMLPAEPADPISTPTTLRVRPGGFGLIGPTDAAFLASARAYGADAIFSGTAGDGAFGYQTSIAPALDALRYRGMRAALSAARDQARITDDNIWSALRHGVRGYFRGIRLWPVDDLLLSVRHASPRPEHPWMTDAGRIPPGQRRYGLGLLSIQPFLDGYDRSLALPKIAPLLSQPLIEYGLGVPSWQWGEGGVNRALARKAFRGDLPDVILARRSKGRILSMFLPAFERNRERLAAYLLDGWLAGAGLLDLDTIADMLTGRKEADTLATLRILQFADIEAWARSVVGSEAPSR